MKDPHSDIFTIGIGGAAGDGVREAASSFGTLLTDLGYEVFISFTYPSLIRGGHNFARISFAKEKVWCDHKNLDILVALNEETIDFHREELNPEAVVFADKFEPKDISALGRKAVALPMLEFVRELGSPEIARNSVALGAACYLLDLPLESMQQILKLVFAEKSLEFNIQLADMGYAHLQKMEFRHTKEIAPSEHNKELIDGNSAFGKGLIAAGLNFYVAYPMTPSSSILHFLAKEQHNAGIKVIQPENEISVINMALGMSYAGKRVAIGSASGGFALMQEAFSFAGIAELPIVVAVSQRQAPATGVPTYSSQTDLRFVLHAGHGEFPRIVIAPGDSEESFLCGANGLNLAWHYQLPVIVLLDKLVSEHSATSLLETSKIKIDSGKIAPKTSQDYGRYEITPDGISPMAFPGAKDTIVKITSYEHDSNGITADEAEPVKAMLEKRFTKGNTLVGELSQYETVKIYGDQNSKNVLLFWGSTKGPVLEAAKYIDKPVKMVQIVWLEPFDSARVSMELQGAEKIIDIECNHNAQLAGLVREKTGIEIPKKILKYDSRPFDPVELATEINSILN